MSRSSRQLSRLNRSIIRAFKARPADMLTQTAATMAAIVGPSDSPSTTETSMELCNCGNTPMAGLRECFRCVDAAMRGAALCAGTNGSDTIDNALAALEAARQMVMRAVGIRTTWTARVSAYDAPVELFAALAATGGTVRFERSCGSLAIETVGSRQGEAEIYVHTYSAEKIRKLIAECPAVRAAVLGKESPQVSLVDFARECAAKAAGPDLAEAQDTLTETRMVDAPANGATVSGGVA